MIMSSGPNSWKNYFSDHYKSSFDKRDVERAKKFLHGQIKEFSAIAPIRKSDVVLEIGCALGAFIETLKECGVQKISAIELDEDAARYTRETQGIDVYATPIINMTGENAFDKIYAFEVLEHLTNPLVDLEKIYDLLKPGGQFIGSTPYPFKRSISSDNTHLFVLHPDNWARLFEYVGFEVQMIRPATGLPFAYRFSSAFSIYFKIYVPLFPVVSTTLFSVKKPLR